MNANNELCLHVALILLVYENINETKWDNCLVTFSLCLTDRVALGRQRSSVNNRPELTLMAPDKQFGFLILHFGFQSNRDLPTSVSSQYRSACLWGWEKEFCQGFWQHPSSCPQGKVERCNFNNRFMGSWRGK